MKKLAALMLVAVSCQHGQKVLYTDAQRDILSVSVKYTQAHWNSSYDARVYFLPTVKSSAGTEVAGRYLPRSNEIYVSTATHSLTYQCATLLHELTHVRSYDIYFDADASHELFDYDSHEYYSFCDKNLLIK